MTTQDPRLRQRDEVSRATRIRVIIVALLAVVATAFIVGAFDKAAASIFAGVVLALLLSGPDE